MAEEPTKTKRKFFRRPGSNRTSRQGTTPGGSSTQAAPPSKNTAKAVPERRKPPTPPTPERRITGRQVPNKPPASSRVEVSRSSSSDEYVHVMRGNEAEAEDEFLVHPPSMMKRVSIHRKKPSLGSYQSTPIAKHYEVSKQILATYDSHYESKLWVTAYAIGLQFVELALLEIPKHGYFFSSRHERMRMENSIEAARVSLQLLEMPGSDKDRVQRLLKLAHTQVQQASSDQERQLSYEHRRAEIEEQSVYDTDWVLCEPSTILTSCSESLSMSFSLIGANSMTEPPTHDWTPDAGESKDGDESSAALSKALFLSGIEFADDELREDPPGFTLERSSSQLEIATLATLRHKDFDDLLDNGRVELRMVNTFQGRVPGSTNGCAVIAPLLCSFHLANTNDSGLSDETIQRIIDTDSSTVLQTLRTQLDIPDQAFLIPSDANDYLLEQGYFKQDQFVTVSGGNILDEEHLNAFLKVLSEEKTRHKLAATIFFHEHVFAILKVPFRKLQSGRVSYRYELIDSLPLKDTVCRSDETVDEMCRRLGMFNGLTDEEKLIETEMKALPRTVCFRCRDVNSLMGVLWWYACSKFTEENMKYIDHIRWNDVQNDFDPRVFQAFIWGSSNSDDNSKKSSGDDRSASERSRNLYEA